MKTLLALFFGSTLGLLGHQLSPFIDKWDSLTFARLFRYGIGMCLIVPTVTVLRHGLRLSEEAETLIKDLVLSWILVGTGVMLGYIIDQRRDYRKN